MGTSNLSHKIDKLLGGLKLKKLNTEQIIRIDEMLDSLGDYGELHLVVQHGNLKYINKVESFKAPTNSDSSKSLV